MRGEVQQHGTEVPNHGEYDSRLGDLPSEIDRCRTLAPYSRAEHTLASLTYERGGRRPAPGRPFEGTRARKGIFPEPAVAALCATLAVQGGNRIGPVGRPRMPSARWLRTFGSFRVGRAGQP
jgi:hypothetical protein